MLDPLGNPQALLRKIEKDRRKEAYKNKGRDIPEELWNELKAKRICDNCKQTFNQPLYIHHKIPVKEGGESTRENLMVLCWECHQKLDPKHKHTNKTHINFTPYWRRKRR